MKQNLIVFISFLFLFNIQAQTPQQALQKALALAKECEWKKAIHNFEVADQEYSNNTSFLYKYAHTLKDGQHTQQAIVIYKKIIALNKSHAHAHLDLAFCYLTLGDFLNGLPELMWRSPQIKHFRQYKLSDFDFTDKIVLVRAEWGMGDMIQFIRFAEILKKHGATVLLQAYPALAKLLEGCRYIDHVFPVGEAFPPHDIQIPLMSLMEAVNAKLENLPTEPYLQADQKLVKFWAKKTNKHNFNIGICWSGRGGPEVHPRLKKNIPLQMLKPLAKIPGVKFYSLQKANDIDQLKNQNWIYDFGPDFDVSHGRFMDTAAVMKNLDLVLTVDTSIAHLAGALAKPVWVLLPKVADGRWMLNREDSPWYPTMRLFRQEKSGSWKSVFEKVYEELVKLLKCKS